MAAKNSFRVGFAGLILAFIMLAGCAAPTPAVKRVALLAPFEGTYREVGYDALYPLRLALLDAAVPDVQLISVDDGGRVETAVARAAALAADPTVLLVLAAGPTPADPRVLAALDSMPVIVVGHWHVEPDEHVVVMASSALQARLTRDTDDLYTAVGMSDPVGGEVIAMKSFAALNDAPAGVTVLTSAAPPSPVFVERLLASDLFVPEPGLLTTLAYDAGLFTSRVLEQAATRDAVRHAIRTVEIDGINGTLGFGADGYWTNAPIHEYTYRDGTLVIAGQ